MDNDRLNTASKRAAHRVVVLAYPGLCLFEFGIAAELFGLARPEIEQPWYAYRVAGVAKQVKAAIGGVHVQVDGGIELLSRAQTIVIPGWSGPDVRPSPELKAALRRAHARGVRMLTICSGAFLLGHCGLLDGQPAATHWRYEETFRRLFPEAHLVHDALYVEAGNIITSAGSAAGIDAGLHVIRQDFGTAIANQVAQRLVMPPHREGGQRQYIPAPVPARRRDRFDGVLDWARARINKPMSTEDMAAFALMSARSFHRRFSETVGQTPAVWLIDERLRHARSLLEAGRHSLLEVAEASGFASMETFRAAFRRRLGVSPSAYRASFGFGTAMSA